MGVTHAHASAPARLAACPEGADRAHGLEGLELGLADAVAVAESWTRGRGAMHAVMALKNAPSTSGRGR